ncbi:DUF2721 domain-containing protein [Arundinibacter roseus]|uniref:DUF2721 domain-containing protein n=1 Tax=Arundinibacter roseus TaxID=2070510 RepID=A0A4R4KLC2_9BACT|nr:DUF2721 domain-containing protein [Arundinibacter roseus]TDB67381.1 DUF2721 domain-containing protein [Arundinibacter roseus]
MGDLPAITRLSQTLTILSSMIAPVVLILACGSLITITSQRLSRVIDRCRYLLEQLKTLVQQSGEEPETLTREGALLFYLMEKATTRTRLLQRALTTLYLSLGVFIATSLSLGILDVINSRRTWLPVLLSMIGAVMLFYTSVLLIRESSLARQAVNREMDEALHYFKTNLEGLTKRKKRWWQRRRKTETKAPEKSEVNLLTDNISVNEDSA